MRGNQSWRFVALAIAVVLVLLAKQESNQAQSSDASLVQIGSPATTADSWVRTPRFDRSELPLQFVSLETLPPELQEPEAPLPEPVEAAPPQFVPATTGCGCGCADCTCDPAVAVDCPVATTTYTTTVKTYAVGRYAAGDRMVVRVRDWNRQPVRNLMRGCGRLVRKIGQRVRPRGEVIRVRYRSGILLQDGSLGVGCG